MIHLEKFLLFRKNNTNHLNLIKMAEKKIRNGNVHLKSSYFSGKAVNKSIIIEVNDGTISFRKNDEKYQLKYFPNNPHENIDAFDIEKETFDKYWDICIDKGVIPKEETWIPSETKSRLGKSYKKK